MQQQQQFRIKNQLKLLTYNVFMRPPGINTNGDDYKNERHKELLQHIDSYDIICFQELFQMGTFRVEQTIRQGIKKKFYYWKMSQSPSFLPGPIVDSGLLVISKYRIIKSYFKSYNIGILSDSAADKGYIYCKIRLNKSYLHLFTTHLQASYSTYQNKIINLTIQTRLQQIRILNDDINKILIQQNYNYKDIIILAGDLNINSLIKDIKIPIQSHLLEEKFNQFNHFKNIFKQNKCYLKDLLQIYYGEHKCTFGNEKILTHESQNCSNQRLDYIFEIKKQQFNTINNEIQLQNCMVQKFIKNNSTTIYQQLSDHYGISVIIKF